MQQAKPRRQGDAGFTLMELIVTIAIAGILAALAIGTSSGFREKYAIRGAARQIYSDMQHARASAVQDGVPITVTFNGTSGAYSVGEDPDEDGTIDTVLKSASVTSEYPGITVCATSNATFRGDGTATPSGGGMYLQSGDLNKRVSVRSTGTGSIRITDETCP